MRLESIKVNVGDIGCLQMCSWLWYHLCDLNSKNTAMTEATNKELFEGVGVYVWKVCD